MSLTRRRRAAVCVRRLTRQWPVPRFGSTADIADVVEFLAGPQSSWLTGQILVADGGARLVSSTDLIEAATQ
jgi:NAD(P)-dependent dehydrogenase (short-subunit alcohol dehydrogenase family)